MKVMTKVHLFVTKTQNLKIYVITLDYTLICTTFDPNQDSICNFQCNIPLCYNIFELDVSGELIPSQQCGEHYFH